MSCCCWNRVSMLEMKLLTDRKGNKKKRSGLVPGHPDAAVTPAADAHSTHAPRPSPFQRQRPSGRSFPRLRPTHTAGSLRPIPRDALRPCPSHSTSEQIRCGIPSPSLSCPRPLSSPHQGVAATGPLRA
jgi:hypothetical protein